MGDYISRSEVIETLQEGCEMIRAAMDSLEFSGKDLDRLEGISEGITDCINAIESAEPADVQPVKRGTWMIGFGYPNPPGTYCSKCGFAWSEQIAAVTLEPVLSRIKTNFCPNCGADMTGGADK